MTERGQHAADGESAEIAQMGPEQRGGIGHDRSLLLYRIRIAPSACRPLAGPKPPER